MTKPRRYFALIPAAGVGSRMGSERPKQYLEIAGKPMLRHAIDAFLACERIAHVFVVVSPEDGWAGAVLPLNDGRLTLLRCGGATRRDSVLNGLETAVGRIDAGDWVLVHDAARPGLTPEMITGLIAAVGSDAVGGLLALPVADTVKREFRGKVETVPRDGLWLAQTPQMFRHGMLVHALRESAHVTDEASAIEAMGLSPRLVQGHVRNVKVTTPADLYLAEMFLQQD